MDKLNLTPEQIKEFAEANDIGLDIFINIKTKEVIELPNTSNDPFLEYDEHHADDLEKVESNRHLIEKIESPNSNESFDIMASFVDSLPDSPLKNKLADALNRSKPFRNFNQIIHNSELRENWFKHKTKMLEERVIEIIEEINLSST